MVIALLVESIVQATVFAFTFRLVILLVVVLPLIFAFLKKITVEGGLLAIVLGAIAPFICQFALDNPIQPMYAAMLAVVLGPILGSLFTQKKGNYIKEIWYFIKAHYDEMEKEKGSELL